MSFNAIQFLDQLQPKTLIKCLFKMIQMFLDAGPLLEDKKALKKFSFLDTVIVTKSSFTSLCIQLGSTMSILDLIGIITLKFIKIV